jgi:subtilisin family serine protease
MIFKLFTVFVFSFVIFDIRFVRGWEDSLKHISGRDVNAVDPAHGIVDIQQYYREIFENDNWEDLDENEVKEQSESMKVYEKIVPGRYSVIFYQHTPDEIIDKTVTLLKDAHERTDGKLKASHFVHLKHAAKGFFATLSEKLVNVLKDHPHVLFVEPNVAFRRVASDEITVMKRSMSDIQWDLDRVDEHQPVYNNHYSPAADGNGVDVYIVDTGINYDHEDLEGRAHFGGLDVIDQLTGSQNKGKDCNGHGTHCAGTVGGKTFGVAKKVQLYSIRALDCKGTGAVDGIAIALDHVIAQHKADKGARPKVVSLSLGIKKNEVLNAAVKKATDSGIVVSSAAGNQGGNSCLYSPASSRSGLSVGASDSHDMIPMFSNVGQCVDLFAPGYRIVSATSKCNSCTLAKSGTSMANPHVAGAAAVLLQVS